MTETSLTNDPGELVNSAHIKHTKLRQFIHNLNFYKRLSGKIHQWAWEHRKAGLEVLYVA